MMKLGSPARHGPSGSSAFPEPPKAAEGRAWQSLHCLHLHRQKKKVAYSAHIYKLLYRTCPTGDSRLVPTALAWLCSHQLIEDVVVEASRLACYGRRICLSHRDVLRATKLVLLRELCKPPPGS